MGPSPGARAPEVLHAKGELAIGQDFVHESIVGTVFTGRLVERTMLGAQPAVVPAITGGGWIPGIAQYVIDSTDPFPEWSTCRRPVGVNHSPYA